MISPAVQAQPANDKTLSPQQRWQRFKKHLPSLSHRQRWLIGGGTGLLILLFGVLVLPFWLPLAGPDPQSLASLADPNGHFITLDGQSIYYQHDVGQGEAVILLHGQAGSTLTWRETMPALHAAGYDVYAIDLVGAGLSAKGLGPDHSHPAQARRVLAFMETLDIEQAWLVAHAFGANVAAHVAPQAPDRVRGLVLVAPTLFTASTPDVPDWLFELAFLRRWARVSLHFVVHEAVGEQLRSATKVDMVVDDTLIADYGRVLRTPDWDLSVLAMVRDSHRNALTAPLTTIQQPVLLVWGTEDGWAPPDSAPDMLAALPGSCLVDLEGVGHLPMHEAPADFSEILIEFLSAPCQNNE